MKKIITGLILIAALMIIFTAGCVDEKENKPVYTIGVDAAMSPWEYVDNDGNPQGIDIELIELIAENQGFNVKYFVPENAEWMKALDNKKIDTIGAVVITPERLEKYDFVEFPFEPTSYLVIARADSKLNIEDVLSGKASIAVPENSIYVEWLQNHFGEKYNSMVSDGKIITKLTSDELAFSVLSREADTAIAGTMTLGNQLNIYQPLKFIGFVGEPRHIGYILRKGDTEFYNKLSEGMKNVQDTDEFDKLIKKYNLQYRKDTYVVGIDEYNDPWTYIGNDGKYTGFDIDMIEWIAEQNDLDIKFVPYSWKNNLNGIIVGDIDMWASSMSVTEDRQRYIAFSTPYYKSGIGFAVKPGSSLTTDDFTNPDFKIAAIYGTTYVSWLEKYLGKEVFNSRIKDGSIVLVSDGERVNEMLASGETDFVVSGEMQMKYNKNMKQVYLDDDVEDFAVAMSNGNFVLQSLINDALEKFESSGKYDELIKKYGL